MPDVGNTQSVIQNALSLRRRVLNAGAWSFAAFGLSQVIRFGSNLVMSRLLAPEMFGVMAIATTVLVAFAMFFDVGLRANIVQNKRGNEPAFLNAAWIIQIFQGVLICIGAMCIGLLLLGLNRANLVAPGTVYADPELAYVIIGISCTGLLGGVRSTKLHEAYRTLSFNRITQIEIISQLCAVVTMITWAIFDRSIWAIVAGAVTSNAVTAILSHSWLPGTANRLQWDWSAAREIFHFGKWILLSSALFFLVGNGDRLLLGRLTAPNVLGAYSVAFVVFAVVDQLAARLISEISFPALSEIARNRNQDLKSTYYRLHIVIGSFAYLCAGLLIVSGQHVIDALYDSRYHDAGWMLQILALALAAAPYQLGAQLYVIYGAPRLFSRLVALRLVGLLAFTGIGFAVFGLSGAIGGIALSYWCGVPAVVYYTIKYQVFDFQREMLLIPVLGLGMVFGEGINQLLSHHFFLF